MKIIFITASFDLGGSERRAITLAKYFQFQGAEVELWGFDGPGRLSQICDEVQLRWKLIPFNWYQHPVKRMIALLNLLNQLKAAKPDILLPHTVIPNAVCGLIWQWSWAKKCIGYEGGYEFGLANQGWEKYAAKRLSSIICNSHHLADAMSKSYGLDRNKINIIPNGIDLPAPENSRSLWREKLGVDENTFLAVMVSNLSRFKDHQTLLSAWKLVWDQLSPSERNAQLLLAGKDLGTGSALKEQVRELGLENSVLFLGQVEDVSGLLHSVDIGVFSSNSEGSPNGVLECMQAGLAVAATDIEGISEIVGDDYQWLSSPGDADQFAKNILALKRDATLRVKIGGINRERIAERHSPQKMCEATEKLINREH
ncbi:MAG: glycosyltransferase [Chloroflexi bacterium]|nr:glycosyltransferase [Chloroflexota bacterium]